MNDQFLEAEQATIPCTDRGFLLGDGLFETFLVTPRGTIPFFHRHYGRLKRSARLWGIPFTLSDIDLKSRVDSLIALNAVPGYGSVRLTLTRGSGPRGVSVPKVIAPLMMMQLTPLEPPSTSSNKTLMVSSFHRSQPFPLSAIKHLGYQVSILAKQEAENNGVDDALLLNQSGHVVCATAANIFSISQAGTIHTPGIRSGCLPGVTRSVVLTISRSLGLSVCLDAITLPHLMESAALFLTNSLGGIQPVTQVNEHFFNTTHPILDQIQKTYGVYAQSE